MTTGNIVALHKFRGQKEEIDVRSKPAMLSEAIDSSSKAERRLEERFRFNMERFPTLLLEDKRLRVLDLSATGLKFVARSIPHLSLETVVEARLLFARNGDLHVQAKIVRIVGDLVAAEFGQPLSNENVLAIVR